MPTTGSAGLWPRADEKAKEPFSGGLAFGCVMDTLTGSVWADARREGTAGLQDAGGSMSVGTRERERDRSVRSATLANACSGANVAAPGPIGRMNDVTAGAAGMDDRQQPILGVIEGGEPPSEVSWDARFELALATFIDRHLAADPPPAESQIAADARRWSQNLRRDGQARLEAMGLPRLHAAS